GIIQESEWTKPDSYLGKIIAEKELYKNRGMGRIYRVVHDDFKRDRRRPDMLNEPGAKLLSYLDHPNGWWRDNAQQLIIIRNDQSVVPELKKIATGEEATLKNKPGALARIHALWTLEGLDAIDKPTLIKAFADPEPEVRKAAIWISEKYINEDNMEIIEKLASLKNDSSNDVRVQLSLSLRTNNTVTATATLNDLLASNQNNQMIQFSYSTFIKAKKTAKEEAKRTKNLSRKDRELVINGAVIYKQLCASCHGVDGKGITIGGNEMPAPPLAGSPRVKGDKIMNIQLLLYGLKGPVDGKEYKNTMPSMAGQNDKWIASVLSYIRNSSELGNTSSVVTEEEVRKVRAESPKEIPGGITLQLLEIFKLGRAERNNWDKKR
ncbi:MAG TPA: c-type cytochrome, partial [Flavitalea sp.]|nr:c-type cytochrome [Flavitalea sp.]